MDFRIREARDDDREVMRDINEEAWREIYPSEVHGISREDIENHIEKRRQGAKQKKDKSCKTFVVEVSGEVIGYCVGCVRENVNQLRVINFLPEYRGKGIGRDLFEYVEDNFFDKNKDTVVTVATYNTQAIEAYKRWGFVDTGKRLEDERFRFKSGSIIPEMELVKEKV